MSLCRKFQMKNFNLFIKWNCINGKAFEMMHISLKRIAYFNIMLINTGNKGVSYKLGCRTINAQDI